MEQQTVKKQTLTDVGVRALQPPLTGQFIIWDSGSPVGIRVSKGGSKTFVVMVGSGKRRVIGRFGVISIANARILRQSRRLRRLAPKI